jgi:hypothetical protein
VVWVKWNLVLVHSEIVFITTQDWCTVCTEHAIGSYIVLGASNELLSDVGAVEARFGPFGDGVILDPRLVHGLRRMYHDQENHFGHT